MMRVLSVVTVSVMLLFVSAGAASAQDRPVHFQIGGGPTFVLGDLGERFETGWGPALAVTFNGPNDRIGFQFEYAYRLFRIPDEDEIGRLSAEHETHQVAGNVQIALTGPDSPVRVYLVGGSGMYYRKVEITAYAGSGVVCDPYLYVCGTYPVTDVLGSRGGWDFGVSVGGGVGFRVGAEGEIFLETRYHYVWGPEIAPNVSSSTFAGGKANGTYMPVTFGFRF
jgi:hypothetical protein